MPIVRLRKSELFPFSDLYRLDVHLYKYRRRRGYYVYCASAVRYQFRYAVTVYRVQRAV